MSSTSTLSVNNILSFNGHGRKITSGDDRTFKLPKNVYVLVPFGIGVDGVKKSDGSSTQKTYENFKGLDVCYTTPAPTNTDLTFEEIMYDRQGKIKFTFNSNVDANVDAKWHLYKPGEQIPNVEYYSFKPSDAAGGSAQNCDNVAINYNSYIKDLMNACLSLKDDNLNKKVCAYFVSKSDTSHDVFTDSAGNYHLKLKICGDGKSQTTTLKELAENCHKLVEFSRNFVKSKKSSGETYEKGYDDDNIFPKSGPNDPIILLPFVCNSCNSGQDIQLIHNYINDNSDASLKPLSDIIADLSGGGGGGGGGPAESSDPVPSGKVAQFFMTFEKGGNGGLKSDEQAEKIVNVVKCLMAKGYKHIGLTYSANQDQTTEIFSDYNYNKDSSDNKFADNEEKNISSQVLGGANQANVLTKLNDIIKNNASYSDFKKAFRVIPFTTMRYDKSNNKLDLDVSASGNNTECIEAAKNFLKLENSIILGWCNQDSDKLPDKTEKKTFAIGGGEAAQLKDANKLYIPEYLQFLESNWSEDVQKIVTQCSPSPTSVESPVSPPKDAPEKPLKDAPPVVEKKPFDVVLKDLEGKLTQDSEDFVSLGLTLPDFLYPPDGDKSAKKNLNSAEPAINVMIAAFQTADGGDKDFYLGACRSIKAAYDLEIAGITGSDSSAEQAKIRAKLLLNLRKNSLLLKVPARWDYATMTMEKVSGPPDTLDKLMNFSLQDTIEYYSQDGGATPDEKRRFAELNIQKDPTEMILNTAKIPGIDGRFVKGITNVGTSCYFNTGLQLLLCDDDFLQLIVTAISKPIEESEYQLTTDIKFISGCKKEDVKKMYDVIDNLTELFKLIRNDNYNIKFYEKLFGLLLPNSGSINAQHDVSEITGNMLTLFQCINNIYVVKLINNLTILTENYSTNDSSDIITSSENKDDAKIKSYAPFLNLKPDIQKITGKQLTLTPIESRLQSMGFTLDKIKFAIQKNPTSDENSLIDVITNIDDNNSELDPIKEEIDKSLPSFSIEGILDNMKTGVKQDIPVDISTYSDNDQLKIKLLETSISKSCILYYLYKICNDEDINNAFQGLLNSKSIETDNSLKTFNPIITNNYFDSNFNKNLQSVIDFINSIKSGDKLVFSKNDCNSNKKLFTDVYTTLENEYNRLTKPTKQRNEIVDIKETSKYIIFFIDRTLGNGVKLNAKIEINKKLTINSKIYILQGYSLHIGKTSTGAHYVLVKCNPNDGEDALIINDTHIQNKDRINIIEKQLYVSAVIYKQKESDVPYSPGGGGFKPTHNTTTHTASKSKHNSSFKVSSSSKSKGKSHNRSHTQRVK
jgi:hypothetical protein